MKTFLLDNSQWDLCLDAAGNIAIAQAPYQLAQDVASALKLFLGELWYDTAKGVPYFTQILGKTPPASVFEQLMVEAALSVPGVAKATCTLTQFENRTVTGQVLFEADDGSTGTVSI